MKNKKYWITIKEVLGYAAMYAVRQSPYNVPEDLEFVIKIFHSRAIAYRTERGPLFDHNDMAQVTREEFDRFLQGCFIEIPEVQKWNERKNGNPAPYKFIDRYSGKGNPDDDFIDLGALARNIRMDLFRELQRDHESDLRINRRWFWGTPWRWWRGIWYRWFPVKPCNPTCQTPQDTSAGSEDSGAGRTTHE